MLRARTLEELVDAAALLSSQPLPRGRRVGVLTNAGGLGILCADACEAAGPRAAGARATRRAPRSRDAAAGARRASRTRSTCSARRPAATYEAALPPLLADPRVDALIVLFVPPVVAGADEVAAAIARAVAATPARQAGARGRDQRRGHAGRAARGRGVAVVRLPGVGGARARRSPPSAPSGCAGRPARVPELDGIDARRRAGVVDAALDGRRALARPGRDARALLEAYGIPLVPERIAATRRRGGRRRARARLPGRRQDRGRRRAQDRDAAASRSTCATRTQVRAAVERIGAPVLVQPYLARRRRAARGVVQDPVFGPLVAFGPGGVLAELIGDAAFRIAPLTDVDAEELVTGGKAGRLVARLPRRAAGRRRGARRPPPPPRPAGRRPPRGRRARPQPGARRSRAAASPSTPASACAARPRGRPLKSW